MIRTEAGAKRMLNVVRALRESPAPERFTMRWCVHACGTPACAFGHYSARWDLQSAFEVRNVGSFYAPIDSSTGVAIQSPMRRHHFEIDAAADDALFAFNGCGDAQTTEEAAQFIEDFVIASGYGHLVA